MDSRSRVLVQIVDRHLYLPCECGGVVSVVEREGEGEGQQFLVLLLCGEGVSEGVPVLLVGRDDEDTAVSLQTNSCGDLIWAPFSIEEPFELRVYSYEMSAFELVVGHGDNMKYLRLHTNSDGSMKLVLSDTRHGETVMFRILQVITGQHSDERHCDDAGPVAVTKSNRSYSSPPSSVALPTPPSGPNLSVVEFDEGPLGMTLRRRADGVIYVHEVEVGTQADEGGVHSGDELWGVGERVIGDTHVDKEQWTETVKYIKNAERPLQMIFRRYTCPPSISGSSSASSSPAPPSATSGNIAGAVSPGQTSSPTTSGVSDSPTLVDKGDTGTASLVKPIPVSQSSVKSLANTPIPAKQETGSESPDNGEVPVNEPPISPVAASEADSTLSLEEESADMISLRKLAARLVFKEKESRPESIPPKQQKNLATRIMKGKQNAADRATALSTSIIVKDGRRIVKHGAVAVAGKRALWNVQNKKYLFLLTDVLLVTASQGDKFAVETLVDLATCKINIRVESDLIDSTTTNPKSVFEVLYPGGSLVVICEDVTTREEWVRAVYECLCESVDEEERRRVIGWRHQYLIGTMHAAVLSRDVRKVNALLEACLAGENEFEDMETQDEEGYTPLHYANILRLTSITRVLHESSADVTIPDRRGLTPLHWAALQLDSEALGMLCTHVFNVDVLDDKGRTPLYLACVEGRDVKGHTDIQALSKSIEFLIESGADPNFKDREGLSVLHYLSASWQHQAIETLLSKSDTTNSSASVADVNIHCDEDGWTPLHFACSSMPLKRAIGEGQKILQSRGGEGDGVVAGNDENDDELQAWIRSGGQEEDLEQTNPADSISTLRVLLEHGAFPNIPDIRGRRPIDIMNEHVTRWKDGLQSSLLLLMSHGGRTEEGPPSELRSEDATLVINEGISMWSKKGLLNGDDIKLSLKEFDHHSDATTVAAQCVEAGKPPPCTLCRATFTIFRRQHHCRLCDSLCCDECSKKRVTISKQAVRVCDGCYNVVSHRIDIARAEAFMSGKGNMPLPPVQHGDIISPDSRDKDKISASRDALFKGTSGKSSEVSKSESTISSSTATMETLADAKLKLQERGEKLEQLSDKSAKLADASKEFANMAKLLKERNQQSWW